MPRSVRKAPGGMVFHVLNRGIVRMRLFETAGDYDAFERVLRDTVRLSPMRVCAYCVMPSHWHLLLWPEKDGHFLAVARYVERNALRANLVVRAEEWRWSSLWRRCTS